MFPNERKADRPGIRIDEAHYPDTVAHIFVVNAPWIFRALPLSDKIQ